MGWFIIPRLGICNDPLLGFSSLREALCMALGLPLRVLVCTVKIGGVSFRLGLREELAVKMGKGYKGER